MKNKRQTKKIPRGGRNRRPLALSCFFICFVLVLSACRGGQSIDPVPDTATQTDETATAVTPALTAAEATTAETASVTDPVTEAAVPLSGEMRSRADAIAERYGATGVQAAILRGGTVSGTYEYGYARLDGSVPVTEDTKFRIASLSKLVTDAVFMAMADDGLVSEEMDINGLFDADVRNPYYPDAIITPAMLMTHSSSLADGEVFLSGRNGNASISIEDVLRSPTTYASYEPGSCYSYCNFGVALIGSICERAAGQSFEALASKYIFAPLQIDAGYTASRLRDPSLLAVLYGAGGYSVEQQMAAAFSEKIGETYDLVQGNLTISAKDYAKVVSSIIRSSVSGSDGIISGSAARRMLTPRFEGQGHSIGYGTFLQYGVIDGEQLCTHTGSNFGMYAACAFHPQTGDGVVVFTSGASGEADPSTEIYLICLDLIRLLWPGE